MDFYENAAEMLLTEHNRQKLDPMFCMCLSALWATNGVDHARLFSVLHSLHGPEKFTLIKDLNRFIWAYTHTQQPLPPIFVEDLLNRVRKKKTHKYFPVQFIQYLITAALSGVYPEDLLSIAFDPSFVNSLSKYFGM